MRSSGWWVVIAVGVVGCGPKQIEPGLYVTVELETGVASTAVRVFAKGEPAITKPSNCMPVEGKSRLKVGMVQADLPSTIMLEATGYSDADCATPTDPPETAMPVEARFREGVILEATLKLKKNGPAQETQCANGLDDDNDGDRDCADFDCNDRECTNGNRCVEGLRCQSGQCLGGTQVICDSPPSSCFMTGGVCVVDAGCRYVATPGVGCDDRNACTMTSSCQADGTCTGPSISCTTPPPQCHGAVGQCVPDAGCQYPTTPGATCSDGNACTSNDTCDSSGGCSGAPVTCGPRECQALLGACDVDAGCRYSNFDAGTSCAGGGRCNTTGGCIPTWPYVPSNFQLTDVPSLPDAGVVLDCGETIIDTGGSAPTVTNWCAGQPMFGWAVVPQDGGADALLLSFRDLDVMADGGLTVRGPRPAIVAAAGRVRVLGGVTVEAGAQSCSAGGRGGSPASGNGGAGGGGFGTSGGTGGNGGLGVGAAGGGTPGNLELVPLRGGCAGGVGGLSGTRESAGGGGLQISATGDVIITGAVAAPGKGGSGGTLGAGANGAGSGGAVLLEGLQVLLVGVGAVTANGGGGGKGGGALVGGDDGPAGSRTTSTPAPGAGGGNVAGGNGGDGAAGTTAATAGDDSLAAGGGGGGGAGRVRINVAMGCSLGPQTVLSPPATSNKPDAGCP